MNERRKIEEKLKKKEQEVTQLESQIRDGRVYIQALQDVLKLMPKDSSEPDTSLRPGSTVAQARDVILKKSSPMHLSDILSEMGQEVTRANSASLGGSLAAYVRRGEIFTRPAPNTFGLVELGHTQPTETHVPEPPPGFGKLPEADDEIPF